MLAALESNPLLATNFDLQDDDDSEEPCNVDLDEADELNSDSNMRHHEDQEEKSESQKRDAVEELKEPELDRTGNFNNILQCYNPCTAATNHSIKMMDDPYADNGQQRL